MTAEKIEVKFVGGPADGRIRYLPRLWLEGIARDGVVRMFQTVAPGGQLGLYESSGHVDFDSAIVLSFMRLATDAEVAKWHREQR